MWACLGASWPGVPEVQGLDGRVEASDLGHAAQQHQGGRLLAGYCEEGPRQQGLVAIAGPAAAGRNVALITAQPPRHAPAARAV